MKTRYQRINMTNITLKSIEYIYNIYKKTVDLFRFTDFHHAIKIEIKPLFFNFATESF